jgi:hypothetical protein
MAIVFGPMLLVEANVLGTFRQFWGSDDPIGGELQSPLL